MFGNIGNVKLKPINRKAEPPAKPTAATLEKIVNKTIYIWKEHDIKLFNETLQKQKDLKIDTALEETYKNNLQNIYIGQEKIEIVKGSSIQKGPESIKDYDDFIKKLLMFKNDKNKKFFFNDNTAFLGTLTRIKHEIASDEYIIGEANSLISNSKTVKETKKISISEIISSIQNENYNKYVSGINDSINELDKRTSNIESIISKNSRLVFDIKDKESNKNTLNKIKTELTKQVTIYLEKKPEDTNINEDDAIFKSVDKRLICISEFLISKDIKEKIKEEKTNKIDTAYNKLSKQELQNQIERYYNTKKIKKTDIIVESNKIDKQQVDDLMKKLGIKETTIEAEAKPEAPKPEDKEDAMPQKLETQTVDELKYFIEKPNNASIKQKIIESITQTIEKNMPIIPESLKQDAINAVRNFNSLLLETIASSIKVMEEKTSDEIVENLEIAYTNAKTARVDKETNDAKLKNQKAEEEEKKVIAKKEEEKLMKTKIEKIKNSFVVTPKGEGRYEVTSPNGDTNNVECNKGICTKIDISDPDVSKLDESKPNVSKPDTVQLDSRFEKFDKMKKMLPEGAVRQKMSLEGFAQEEIDNFFNGGGKKKTQKLRKKRTHEKEGKNRKKKLTYKRRKI